MASSNTEHELLQYIADSLNAENSKKYKQYLKYFKEIESTLLKSSCFECTRVTLTGSMKKRTAVHHKFDCDIIVYIRMGDSFDDIMEGKKQFLSEVGMVLQSTFLFMQSMKTTPNSFQFSIEGFDFDILPAVDLVDNWNDSKASITQWYKVIQLCNSQSEPHITSYKLKASLSEFCDNFIKQQCDFVRQLIVLCKHWYRVNLSQGMNFSGSSSAMELIAMNVGLQMKSEKKIDLCEAFKRFLEQCSNIENCEIEFSLLEDLNEFESTFIPRTKPYILDPMNPYNNRLYGMRLHSRMNIENTAKQSLEDLNQSGAQSFQFSSNYTEDVFNFSKVFGLDSYLNKEDATYDQYLEFMKKKCDHKSSELSNLVIQLLGIRFGKI